MASFKFEPKSPEVEPKFSEEHKARIQRTMGIPAYDYQKMAKLRGAPRDFTGSYSNVDEDTLSDLYLMGRLFPPTVPEAGGVTVGQSKVIPTAASSAAPNTTAPTAMAMAPAPKAVNRSATKSVNSKSPIAPVANVSPADILKRQTELESELSQQGMGIAPANLTNAMSGYKTPTTPTIPDIGKSIKEGIKSSVATPDIAKAAGELPKTKSGMKKFMDEYGKFIALGALAGTGGKGGAIAAPIMAALPGILKMLQNRGKKKPGAPAGAPAKFPGYSEYDYMTAPAAPVDTLNVAHGGLLGNKSAAHPKKKMAGGTVRKFKGGSMNTLKENIMPKYKKGGDMPKGMPKEMMAMMGKKGKATGDMPEHKKMDMGMPIGKMPDSKKMGMAKPKPSSMDQKFAKGGTARYASGGMCKGYGMAKKIRPTGSMN